MGWSNLKKGKNMDKIVLKKNPQKARKRRAAVAIPDETYEKIGKLSIETSISKERLVQMLLEEALKYVVVEE